MTDMRRVTIAFPDDMDERILELRKDDRFVRCSYSEIVRQILERGFQAFETERAQSGIQSSA